MNPQLFVLLPQASAVIVYTCAHEYCHLIYNLPFGLHADYVQHHICISIPVFHPQGSVHCMKD